MRSRPWRAGAKLGVRVLAVAAVISAVLAVRVLISSHAELTEADRLREAGEVDAAIPRYRRAAAWYVPGNPYREEALARLVGIGQAAEDEGDVERALAAWRGVRAAVMTARSAIGPRDRRLSEADARLAELMSRVPPTSADAELSAAARRARFARELAADPRPSPLWSLAVLLGFATWVLSLTVIALRGFDGEDRVRRRVVQAWGGGFILGFGLFVLGLLLA
jgi:hypothetical protein